MKQNTKILVLHSRLSGYWMACMQAYVKTYSGSFTVIREEPSSNAPFQFSDTYGINLHKIESFSKKELIKYAINQDPDLVYVSGWRNPPYRKIARHFYRTGIPVLCGMDNQWKSTIKQNFGRFIYKYYLKHIFTHLWIPGISQYEFARKLGFKKEQILTGLYSADIDHFSKVYQAKEKKEYPKSFLFTGRLIADKGLMELIAAFTKLKKQINSQWTLTIVGNGPLKEKLINISDVNLIDFVQPEKLPELMAQHGVFVLPSLREPWGVVIHEAAACGKPIISTYQCGAATAFVRNGYNGYLTKGGKTYDLFKALKKITMKSDSELHKMGKRSSQLSYQFTPLSWASTLYNLIKNEGY